MGSRSGVLLSNDRETFFPQLVRETHERRPQPPMHERSFSIHEAEGEDIGRGDDFVEGAEDLGAFLVPPIAPRDRLPGDRCGQVRHGTLRGGQNDTVLHDER
jgi:hypothetical protein